MWSHFSWFSFPVLLLFTVHIAFYNLTYNHAQSAPHPVLPKSNPVPVLICDSSEMLPNVSKGMKFLNMKLACTVPFTFCYDEDALRFMYVIPWALPFKLISWKMFLFAVDKLKFILPSDKIVENLVYLLFLQNGAILIICLV